MTLFPEAAAALILLILTLCLQCVGVAILIEWLKRVLTKDIPRLGPFRSAVLIVKLTIAIIFLHGLVIFLWAGCYRLRCFPSWELAFYFSASSYATVGYGDVILPGSWRLLGPLESMMGVLMCGVSICLVFATVTRLVDRDIQFSLKQRQAGVPTATLGKAAIHSSEQSHA